MKKVVAFEAKTEGGDIMYLVYSLEGLLPVAEFVNMNEAIKYVKDKSIENAHQLR